MRGMTMPCFHEFGILDEFDNQKEKMNMNLINITVFLLIMILLIV